MLNFLFLRKFPVRKNDPLIFFVIQHIEDMVKSFPELISGKEQVDGLLIRSLPDQCPVSIIYISCCGRFLFPPLLLKGGKVIAQAGCAVECGFIGAVVTYVVMIDNPAALECSVWIRAEQCQPQEVVIDSLVYWSVNQSARGCPAQEARYG